MLVRCRFDTSPSIWGPTSVSEERKFTHECTSLLDSRFPVTSQPLRSPHYNHLEYLINYKNAGDLEYLHHRE